MWSARIFRAQLSWMLFTSKREAFFFSAVIFTLKDTNLSQNLRRSGQLAVFYVFRIRRTMIDKLPAFGYYNNSWLKLPVIAHWMISYLSKQLGALDGKTLIMPI